MFSSATAFFQNSGASQVVFLKVFERIIVPVGGRQVTVDLASLTPTAFVAQAGVRVDGSVVTLEAETYGDFQLILKIFDDVADQERDEEHSLPLEVLEDPVGLFTKRYRFPDGRYRIYLEEIRTQRRRLIIEVNVFKGRVVPQNFRDAAGERQPGASQSQLEDATQLDPNAVDESRADQAWTADRRTDPSRREEISEAAVLE